MAAIMTHPLAGAADTPDADRFAAALEGELADLLRFCRFLCRDDEEARDLTQEVMLRALRRAGQFRGGALRPYLFRIAVNARKNRRRFSFVRRLTGSLDADGPGDLPPLGERLAAPGHGAADDLELDEQKRRAMLALDRVPEPFRTALALREIHDLSYSEIADYLEIEVGTVRSRIARGRDALREAFFAMNPKPSAS